jgi:hypothetical protein
MKAEGRCNAVTSTLRDPSEPFLFMTTALTSEIGIKANPANTNYQD